MKNESTEPPAPTLGEIVGVLLPQVEKIEEGFQAVRMTLEGLSSQFGDAPINQAIPPTDPPAVDEMPPASPPTAIPPVAVLAGEPPAEPAAQPEPVDLPPPVEPCAAEPHGQAIPSMTAPNAIAAELPPMAAPAPQPVAETLPPVAVETRPTPIRVAGGDGGNMSQIVFGAKLASAPMIAGFSGELLAAMYTDDADAIGLVGQLMEFRTAHTERMAKLLKELGEAFYRWKPLGDNGPLQALIAWTQALMDDSGLKNRIEIVQVGDRYDMQRHNAKERGVEVSDVLGWVVLRDNGKVYSKANVSVR